MPGAPRPPGQGLECTEHPPAWARSGAAGRLVHVAVHDVHEEVVALVRRCARGAPRSRRSGGARRCSRCRWSGGTCPPGRMPAAGSRAAAPGARRSPRCRPNAPRTRSRPCRARSGRAAPTRSAGFGRKRTSKVRSASRGLPCLKPNVMNVTARRPTPALASILSATTLRSREADRSLVSMETSARSFSGASIERSPRMARSTLPPFASGCRRRVSLKRLMSTSSPASRKSSR